jgi:preprotein translocase subunit YajC
MGVKIIYLLLGIFRCLFAKTAYLLIQATNISLYIPFAKIFSSCNQLSFSFLFKAEKNRIKKNAKGIANIRTNYYLVLLLIVLQSLFPLKYHDLIRCISSQNRRSMILTKELRFGNKLQTHEGVIITVQEILSNTIVYDTQIELNRETVNVRGSHKQDYVIQLNEVVKEIDCQELFPIELTSEILKKIGFRNFLREQWIITIGNSHIDFEFIEGVLKLRCPAPALSKIKYLHQLQNLLFAIAGHELEIELLN